MAFIDTKLQFAAPNLTVVDLPALSPLEQIGITPILDEVANQYKRDYQAYALPRVRGPGPFEWRTISFKLWNQITLGRFARLRKPLFDSFLDLRNHSVATFHRTSAPDEIIKLAGYVQKMMPEA